MMQDWIKSLIDTWIEDIDEMFDYAPDDTRKALIEMQREMRDATR